MTGVVGNGSTFRQLIWLALALFIAYLGVAMAMPAVAMHVSQSLKMGNFASGLAVGIAFFSTILSRAWAGRLADEKGGKIGAYWGLALYVASASVCALSAAPFIGNGQPSYALLLGGRLLLGLGESLGLVGLLSWSLAKMGPSRSGLVLSIFGAGMYSAFVAGGPVGLFLLDRYGFSGLMAICGALPVVSGLMLWRIAAPQPERAVLRPPFSSVIRLIWEPGTVVGLQGIGFAALGAFFPLYFLAKGWDGAGLGLTCFGVGFVVVRMFFGTLPDRIGGTRVALASLAIEIVGQCMLWLAPRPEVAMLGALLTGTGCSMVFPSMGAVAVKRTPPNLRGSAMGGFAGFQDLAYGGTGPLAGWIADRMGYSSVFLLGALCAGVGLLMVLRLHRNASPPSADHSIIPT